MFTKKLKDWFLGTEDFDSWKLNAIEEFIKIVEEIKALYENDFTYIENEQNIFSKKIELGKYGNINLFLAQYSKLASHSNLEKDKFLKFQELIKELKIKIEIDEIPIFYKELKEYLYYLQIQQSIKKEIVNKNKEKIFGYLKIIAAIQQKFNLPELLDTSDNLFMAIGVNGEKLFQMDTGALAYLEKILKLYDKCIIEKSEILARNILREKR